jgi:glycosyltransferase involved in cell wall biosynthesis
VRRIVVNGRFLAQPRTGVQRWGAETLRALDALLTRHPALLNGITWQLAVPHDARDIPLIDNFEIQTLQFLTGHLWEQVPLAAFARGAYLINPSYSAPLFKRAQLVTVHDASVRALPHIYSRTYRWLNNTMTSVLAPRVHTLMTVSQFSAQELRQRFHLKRDDLVVGHAGWEHARVAPGIDEAAVLRRHRLEPGGYLLAVSSPQRNKNFDLIARALALIGGEPMPPVAVAGAADARIYQGGAAVPGALQWLGFVPDEELNVLYRHASWFIFPSLYEGFGLPPLEAMANGCPVLAARAASIPEVCGNAALYFDPQDPASLAARLREVTQSAGAPALRATLKQRALARLERYTWESNARLLLEHLMRCGVVAPRAQVQLSPPGLASSSPTA